MANAKFSELDAAATLDGTEIYPAVQGGNNVKVTGDAVRNGKVKVYRALLAQDGGTGAPIATVLENTLGGTVVWTRSDTGDYRATLAGAFPLGKTLCFVTGDALNISVPICFLFSLSADVVQLLAYDADGNAQDGLGIYASAQILVYP